MPRQSIQPVSGASRGAWAGSQAYACGRWHPLLRVLALGQPLRSRGMGDPWHLSFGCWPVPASTGVASARRHFALRTPRRGLPSTGAAAQSEPSPQIRANPCSSRAGHSPPSAGSSARRTPASSPPAASRGAVSTGAGSAMPAADVPLPCPRSEKPQTEREAKDETGAETWNGVGGGGSEPRTSRGVEAKTNPLIANN